MEVKDLALIAQTRQACSDGEAKLLRERSGLTIGSVAATCEVDEVTVWRWENGWSAPRDRHALRYARVLDMLRKVASSGGEK